MRLEDSEGGTATMVYGADNRMTRQVFRAIATTSQKDTLPDTFVADGHVAP